MNNELIKCGVYFLKKKSEVVYVGQSINIAQRISDHQREKEKDFDSFDYVECSVDNLNSNETFFIHYYNPKYNKVKYHIKAGLKKSINYKTDLIVNMSKHFGIKEEHLIEIRKTKYFYALKSEYVNFQMDKDYIFKVNQHKKNLYSIKISSSLELFYEEDKNNNICFCLDRIFELAVIEYLDIDTFKKFKSTSELQEYVRRQMIISSIRVLERIG